MAELYSDAEVERGRLNCEGPKGLLANSGTAVDLWETMRNICRFHLGSVAYGHKKTVTVLERLKAAGCHSLHGFLSFLIDDLRSGSAGSSFSYIVEDFMKRKSVGDK